MVKNYYYFLKNIISNDECIFVLFHSIFIAPFPSRNWWAHVHFSRDVTKRTHWESNQDHTADAQSIRSFDQSNIELFELIFESMRFHDEKCSCIAGCYCLFIQRLLSKEWLYTFRIDFSTNLQKPAATFLFMLLHQAVYIILGLSWKT